MTNKFRMVRSTVSSMISGIVQSVAFSVANLFKDGQQGFWYDPTKINTLFQDSDGTTPVTVDGEPVGLVLDSSGNVNNGTQTISASRPTYFSTPSRLELDLVDDSIVVDIPVGGWVGSMVLATDQGTASYGVNIPAGDYEIGGDYFPGNSINNVLIREGVVGNTELAQTEAAFVRSGAKASYVDVVDFKSYWRNMEELTSFPLVDTSSGTNFAAAWNNCSSLSSFPLINTGSGTDFTSAWNRCSGLTSFPLVDTSSGTNFFAAWYICSSLTSFPLIDISSGTSFSNTWFGCSSLTSFPTNFFDNCLSTNFTNCFLNTNLSQASIDGILVSINTNGTSNGVFNQSGGSAPSATGESAITSLRSRGWTITVTGGF